MTEAILRTSDVFSAEYRAATQKYSPSIRPFYHWLSMVLSRSDWLLTAASRGNSSHWLRFLEH